MPLFKTTLLFLMVVSITISPTDFFTPVLASVEQEIASDNQAADALVWENLAPGLDFGQGFTDTPEQSQTSFVVLRIDPHLYSFTLKMASNDAPARSISAWAKDFDLWGAINASMYLPDILTSTGYMRSGEHINNPKAGSRLGAFFVANPKEPGLPGAAILEAHEEDTFDLLDKYEIVIQNFRLLSKDGQSLWGKDGAKHGIAAVAQDENGHILFILHPQPISPGEFAEVIKVLSLRGVMYVEGGGKARLLVRRPMTADDENAKPEFKIYRGVSASIIDSLGEPFLPNIIGITPK